MSFMNERPSVDVLISGFNCEETIEKCLLSIINQNYSGDVHIYFFDDASEDSTFAIACRIKDNTKYMNLHIISAEKNIGTYAAKNFLYKEFSKSDFVALHDADDYSARDRINDQVIYLNSVIANNENVVCVGTAIKEFWNDDASDLVHTVADSVNYRGISEVGKSYTFRINQYPATLNKTTLNNVKKAIAKKDLGGFLKLKLCMNGSVLFKRSALEACGLWDGATRIGADTEMFLNILYNGYNISNIQRNLYSRRMHKNSLTSSKSFGIGSKKRNEYCNKLFASFETTADRDVLFKRGYYPDFCYKVY